MEISGKIYAILPLATGEGRNGTWKKQDYVLEHSLDSQYPRKMLFNLWGEKIDQNPVAVGDMVTVSFDIDCREFNGRWYNDIRAWRIVKAEQGAPAPAQAPPPSVASEPIPPFGAPEAGGNEGSDLPF